MIMLTLLRSFIRIRSSYLIPSKIIDSYRYCSASTIPPKTEPESAEALLERAKENLDTGDIFQCCKDLSEATRFALRSYVKELAMLHPMPELDPDNWSLWKYRRLCSIITQNLDERDIMDGWITAHMLDIYAQRNELDCDNVELSFGPIETLIKRIPDLPRNEELAAKLYAEIFSFNEVSIARNIRKYLKAEDHQKALRCFGVTMKYDRDRRGEIVEAYRGLYKGNLHEDLELKEIFHL